MPPAAGHRSLSGWLAFAGALLAVPLGIRPAAAQTPATSVQLDAPVAPGLLLPNYNRVLIGEKEALEAAAFVARADGPVAVFYNPAGLGLATATKVTAGLSTQEWIRYQVGEGATSTARTSSQSVGGVFGVLFGPDVIGLEKWRFGFLIVRPVSVQPALEVRSEASMSGESIRGTYVSRAEMSDFAPSVAAAYNYSPALRVGGSLRVSNLAISQNQSRFIDLVAAGGLQSIESTIFSDGGVWSLVFSGGVQWDAAPRLRVGAHVVLPSVRMWGDSSAIYRGAVLAGGGGRLLRFADSGAELRYRQPFSVSGGVAYTFDRGAIEFDIKQYAGTGSYAILRSDQPVVITTATSGGVTEHTVPFPDLTYTGRAVTNVALGGHVQLSDAVTLHGGFYTDRSPVGSDDRIAFNRMDLTGVTVGAAVRVRGFSGSVGMAYVVGSSPLEIDLPIDTRATEIRVRSLQLLYAVSIAF